MRGREDVEEEEEEEGGGEDKYAMPHLSPFGDVTASLPEERGVGVVIFYQVGVYLNINSPNQTGWGTS